MDKELFDKWFNKEVELCKSMTPDELKAHIKNLENEILIIRARRQALITTLKKVKDEDGPTR
jgi:hypothetical protein